MKAIDYIKMEMEMCKGWVLGLVADMKDAPLTVPTPKGGNHPMWILGHMAYSEANLLNVFIRGGDNPLAEWKDLFGQGSDPSEDATAYPAFDEVMSKYEAVRADTMKYLDSIADEDIDKPSSAPEESKAFFGTIGACLAAMTVHFAFHGGQVADARRAAGRAVLMG